MNHQTSPHLSIIVAVRESPDIPALHALLSRAQLCDAEVIVVSGVPLSRLRISPGHSLVTIQGESHELTPVLWARGIDTACGAIIAFIDPLFEVSDSWFKAVNTLSVLPENVAGIGGPVYPSRQGLKSADWAYLFLRYSRFFKVVEKPAEIAGDNAAYRACSLRKYDCAKNGGFWETLFHAQLRERGETIAMSEDMAVHMLSGVNMRQFFGARFHHGFHFGSTRAMRSIERAGRILLAPLILPLLFSRLSRHCYDCNPKWLAPMLSASPALLLFLSAWCFGEVMGYLIPKRLNDRADSSARKAAGSPQRSVEV